MWDALIRFLIVGVGTWAVITIDYVFKSSLILFSWS